MAQRKRTATIQLKVRMKEPVRGQLEKAAKARGVSMNAEIGKRLERSFEIEDRLGGPQLINLIETIASVMKLTGEYAALFESGNVMKRGEWLFLPYAFDRAIKAAEIIMEHYRPPGEIVVPKPNVVEVIGVRGTKVDPKESVARLHQMFAELGPLMAASAIKKKGEGT